MEAKVTRSSVPNADLLEYVRELVASGKTVEIPARGNSMLPSIRDGRDSIELVAPDHPAPGSIALCLLPSGNYVLHRIVSIDKRRVVLHGDGNLVGDELCRPSDILALAVAIVRPSGKRISCSDTSYNRKIRLWLSAPYFVRRVCLGILRRIL